MRRHLLLLVVPFLMAAAPTTTTPPPESTAVPTTRIVIPMDEGQPKAPAAPAANEAAPVISVPLQIHYGDADLPPAVKKTRAALLEAAKKGDINALKPIFQAFKEAPIISQVDQGDSIDLLRKFSGDEAGREILAIMSEILEAGWVVTDKGTDAESYVFPYFARMPLESLTAPQQVELYRIITAGDYAQMKEQGAYAFFRAEFSADGDMKVFTTDY